MQELGETTATGKRTVRVGRCQRTQQIHVKLYLSP